MLQSENILKNHLTCPLSIGRLYHSTRQKQEYELSCHQREKEEEVLSSKETETLSAIASRHYKE